MPKRLNSNTVKNLFEQYGYRIPDNFTYRNNTTKYTVFDEQLQRTVRLNYKNLQYRIRTGRSEYQLPSFETVFGGSLLDIAQSDMGMSDIESDGAAIGQLSDNATQTSFDRWLHKRSDAIQSYSNDTQHTIYTQTQDLIKSLLKKQNFTIHIDTANRLNFMHAFTEAAKIAGPKLGNINTRLTVIDSHGRPSYEHL